tara:strand:+ start:1386 stop:1802 length:417 start_codon:yes stop_codon:yes gene_type:complete
MIKVQKKDFNLEKEINDIKDNLKSVGAVCSFIGYVRDLNNNKIVKGIDLEVYREMAISELSSIKKTAIEKWGLADCLIIHRYGKLNISEKIVLVACFSKHRKESEEACQYIMDYLKKDAPFWKKEFYREGSSWLKNTS